MCGRVRGASWLGWEGTGCGMQLGLGFVCCTLCWGSVFSFSFFFFSCLSIIDELMPVVSLFILLVQLLEEYYAAAAYLIPLELSTKRIRLSATTRRSFTFYRIRNTLCMLDIVWIKNCQRDFNIKIRLPLLKSLELLDSASSPIREGDTRLHASSFPATICNLARTYSFNSILL